MLALSSEFARRSVGIIGLGFVGTLTRQVLDFRCGVVPYDIASDAKYPYSELSGCAFAIICVNTPTSADGSADLSQVHSAFAALPPEVPVILRSTVPPGTSLQLAGQYSREVIFWPEYAGERRFVADTTVQLDQRPFEIVGARRSEAASAWIDLLAETYGPLVRIYQMEPTAAEVAKYMTNCYFAVKTTFVNEFRKFCEAAGVDWQTVREGWLLDPRIERDHSDAFKSAPGYGGRCLPKDVAAMTSRADQLGMRMPLLESVGAINSTASEGRRDAADTAGNVNLSWPQ